MGNSITGGRNRAKVVGGLNIAKFGPLMDSNHSKLIGSNIGKFSEAPAHYTITSWSLNGANHSHVALKGSEESCFRNKTYQS